MDTSDQSYSWFKKLTVAAIFANDAKQQRFGDVFFACSIENAHADTRIATNQYGRNKLQINMNNLSHKNPIEMELIFLSSGK